MLLNKTLLHQNEPGTALLMFAICVFEDNAERMLL